jgi:hypothetical protein
MNASLCGFAPILRQPRGPIDSRTAGPRAQPRLQEQADGLRNPGRARHPAPHGAFVHSQAPGALDLTPAQPFEGATELLRRHGHSVGRKLPVCRWQGKLPEPTSGSRLSHRAICPRFSSRCLIILQTRPRVTSTAPSCCWKSLRTTSASPARASWVVTITSVWWSQHDGGCGSHGWRCGRPSALRGAFCGNLRRSVGSRFRASVWPSSALRSCCGSSHDRCEVSSDWSSRCERFDRERMRASRLRRADHA